MKCLALAAFVGIAFATPSDALILTNQAVTVNLPYGYQILNFYDETVGLNSAPSTYSYYYYYEGFPDSRVCNGPIDLQPGYCHFNTPVSVSDTFTANQSKTYRTVLMNSSTYGTNAYITFTPITGQPVFISLGAAGDPLAAPEPATWAMMLGGFGLIGAAMRRRSVRITYC